MMLKKCQGFKLKLFYLLFSFGLLPFLSNAQTEQFSERMVNFNRVDGAYSDQMLQEDFGNGTFPAGRNFASIRDSVYKITFVGGQKVMNTGAAVQPKIDPAQQYVLEYRIKYDSDFEDGLHGKQFGFVVGVGYDGGRGEEARNKGDGGSVRIQFDVKGDSISNRLYVYNCEMKGRYGHNPGGQFFSFKAGEWTTIRMKLTLESSVSARDARIEVWCNGRKEIDVQNLKFVRMEDARRITRLSFESFPGGGGAIPDSDNFLYLDDLHWW